MLAVPSWNALECGFGISQHYEFTRILLSNHRHRTIVTNYAGMRLLIEIWGLVCLNQESWAWVRDYTMVFCGMWLFIHAIGTCFWNTRRDISLCMMDCWAKTAESLCIMSMTVLTHCGLVMPYSDIIWVNIGSGNGLMPDGTKPLPEPMMISHLLPFVVLTWEQFHIECPSYNSV